jgi:hypothetical protein
MTLPPSGLPGYPRLVSLVTGLANLDGQLVVSGSSGALGSSWRPMRSAAPSTADRARRTVAAGAGSPGLPPS